MRALVKVRADSDEVQLRSIEEKALPASGHARVAVVAAGICGTDLHILDGSYSSRPPVVLGHEVSGTVVEVSADVDTKWVGKSVAMETFYSTCGTCAYCRNGQVNLCADRVSIGSGVDGGFAESLVVPVRNLHELPAGLDVVAAALCEPLACVCQSLFSPQAVVRPGDRVLVTGPGAVGILAAQVARAAGGSVTIIGTGADELRLTVARSLGFDTLVAPVSVESLPESLAGGADVVIECSGSGAAMRSGFELIRKRGRYVQIGQTGDEVMIPFAQVSFKELSISGGFASTPQSWARAMALLESQLVELSPLVGSLFELEQWSEAFEATRSGAGVKALFIPNGVNGTAGGAR